MLGDPIASKMASNARSRRAILTNTVPWDGICQYTGRQISSQGTVLVIGQHCPLGQGCIRKYPYIIGMLTMLNLIPPCREGEITCLICIDNIFLMILIQHNW